MDDLNFSALSDDQILMLIRAALREVASRGVGCQEATRSAMLDEAERANIARGASEQEAASLRAAERERVARDARERVRAEHDADEAEIRRMRAREAGQNAAAQTRARDAQIRQWLQRAATLVEREPAGISIVYADTNHGRRVMINPGRERYAREHLADFDVRERTIRTIRSLVPRKPDLADLLAEFAALHPTNTILIGDNYDWSTP